MASRKRSSPQTRRKRAARRPTSRKVAQAIRKFKRGTLRAGRSGAKVRSRAQALAIGLAEARRAGGRAAAAKGKRRTRRNRSR